ncbi:23S rRNA pseudouridine1911/1915/1917 synthase [Bacillus pakistanensis]|uniref:Pseudouridine synthase n=1 Tax=Rossellomorea pakistanensis TaxID=992288 RepID=A0ABS2NFE2_9BACI|nr:RluA family pseudouridine synthase [Bacillus pakistanensis]MBM7586540.1 23S rRNA pseudouridine1911/1915/1917 synthase [Bacillus pakistanensis]
MNLYLIKWTIKERDENKKIKHFLHENLISRRTLKAIKFDGGHIHVNGKEIDVRYPLKVGDLLEVAFPPEIKSEKIQGEVIPMDIVYEDRDVLVVNKPAGMNTIPSREHPEGSLANAIIGYYERNQVHSTVHIVTRLDRQTSGLLLVAKHRHVHHLFSLQQNDNIVKRRYEALVEGKLENEQGSIIAPIGRKLSSIIEREVRNDGRYACTHYKVLGEYDEFSHLSLELETGRTHQIRVHLSHIGHPLLGDDLYGGKMDRINRQALHCVQLSFYHPVCKKKMNFFCKLPEDIQQLQK